jgi:short-subunit dehydrogenase
VNGWKKYIKQMSTSINNNNNNASTNNYPTAIILGAGNFGLAYGIAIECRLKNMNIIIGDYLPKSKLENCVKKLQQDTTTTTTNNLPQIDILEMDITNYSTWEKPLISICQEQNVTLIFNGIAIFLSSPSDVELTFKINYFSAIHLHRTLIPILVAKKQQKQQQRCQFVQCGSLASLTSGAVEPYLSSKVALLTTVESDARELQQHQQSNVVSLHIFLPAVVQSSLAINSQTIKKQFLQQPPLKNTNSKNKKQSSFAGDDGSGLVLQKLLSLGLTPRDAAKILLKGLESSQFYIIAGNLGEDDFLRKCFDRRTETILNRSTKPVQVVAPPIVDQARKLAGL